MHPLPTSLLAASLRVFSPLIVTTVVMTATPVTVENAGLEEPYLPIGKQAVEKASGEVAHGWSARAASPVRFARESAPELVREGFSSQRIDLLESTGKQTEITRRLTLEAGSTYRVTIWLKAGGLLNAQLSIREAAPPYQVSWGRGVQISPEWAAWEFTGTATSSDALFVLALHTPGSVWIDDLQIETVNPAATQPTHSAASVTRISHNLLPNSSFEAGVAGGWSALIRSGRGLDNYTRIEYGAPHFSIDTEHTVHGAHSLRIPLDLGLAMIVTSPLVTVRAGEDYTASVSLRASKPTQARVALLGPGGRNDLLSDVTRQIGPDWQRVSLTAKANTTGRMRLHMNTEAGGPVELWIDAAQLEAGATASDYDSPFPFELSLDVPRPGHIVFDRQPTPVEMSVGGAAHALPVGARVKLDLETLATKSGATNLRQSLPDFAPRSSADGDAASAIVARMDIPAGPRGMFKLHGTLLDAEDRPLSAPVATTFARLPPPSDLPAEESFFGIHIPLKPEFIATARALGNRWIRLHDGSAATKWAAVESKEGQFRFVDNGVDAARAAGLSILGMFDGAPPWASAKPRATGGYWATYNYPNRADGDALWTRYVARTVAHYRGRIDHWEVWNEPWHNQFFPGTPAQYGQLLGLAANAARAASPRAIILGFNTAAHKSDWTREALAATPPDAFDIFSFHDYNPNFYGGHNSNAQRLAGRFTDIQRPWGEPRPLWNTEGGPGRIVSWHADTLGGNDGLALAAQMTHIVRFDVTQMSAGVRRSFYYFLNNAPPSGETGYNAMEHDGAIRPVMAARAVLASLIDGSVWQERTEPVPGVDAHVFRLPDGSRVSVLWRFSGGTLPPLTLPKGATVRDILGNPTDDSKTLTITNTPIYLITPP